MLNAIAAASPDPLSTAMAKVPSIATTGAAACASLSASIIRSIEPIAFRPPMNTPAAMMMPITPA